MQIIQLKKNRENLLANMGTDLHFLRLDSISSRYGKERLQLFSKRVVAVSLEDLDEYLNDPYVALVKVVCKE